MENCNVSDRVENCKQFKIYNVRYLIVMIDVLSLRIVPLGVKLS